MHVNDDAGDRAAYRLPATLRASVPVLLIGAAFVFVQCSAQAAPIFVTKADVYIGGANPFTLIGTAGLKLALFVGSDADKAIPIPLNMPTKGAVGASTRIISLLGETAVDDPVVPTDPKKPSLRIATILTPGNPPVTSSVSAVSSQPGTLNAAFASAKITGIVAPNGKSAAGQTDTKVATGAVTAGSTAVAVAGTDPFELTPFMTPMPAFLMVDLAPQLDMDPTDTFAIAATAQPGAFAKASYSIRATSNIPSLPTLFSLGFSADSMSSSLVNVAFMSPLISQPISSSDFANAAEPGLHLLDPGKRFFTVPFTIPAGELGMDNGSAIGLALNFNVVSSGESAVPEPATVWLMFAGGLAIFILTAYCRRTRTIP